MTNSKSPLHQSLIELNNHLSVKVDLPIPSFDTADIQSWATVLFEHEISFNDEEVSDFKLNSKQDFLFIKFFIESLRFFYELGRIPIFDTPKIIQLDKNIKKDNEYRIEMNVSLVDLLPNEAHHLPVQLALILCQWMAQNKHSATNLHKLSVTVTEKLIQPLQQLVPAGKSTIPLLKAAHQLGIPFLHLGLGIYQLGWGSKAKRFDRSACEHDSMIGSRLAQNKALSAHIIRSAGLPAPVHDVVSTESEAMSSAKKIGFPLVIKPIDLDRGEGVFVDIADETKLIIAFHQAHKLSKSKNVLVEQQVLGVCHRLFVANQKVIYTIKRNPISVKADGKSTIKELVDKEIFEQSKKPSWCRSEIKPIDNLALETLNRLGLSAESIPEKNEVIPLRRIQSSEWGGTPEDVSHLVHPENLIIALQAANLFQLNIAGIDIISPDISKPWYVNGAIINEVNFAPLLGGTDISKAHIPEFISEYIVGNGEIPVEIFKTENDAFLFQDEFIKQGVRCFLITSDKTIDNFNKEVIMPVNDIKQRFRALTLRSDVDAIAVVIPVAS